MADYFLFDLQRGYCDYYATTMVVLTRSVGIPARFVSGYSPGSYDAPNAKYIVRELNAHSWVEIYFPEIGWIEFEPTASLPEIEHTDEILTTGEDQANEANVSELLTRFRLERILLWLSPVIGIVVVLALYFLFIERWMILRLAPETAIERIYQQFYLVGRSLAGEWTYAETSSEYLSKLVTRLNEQRDTPGLQKLIQKISLNAIALTDLYHTTLFVDRQINKKAAYDTWILWVRLRRQLYTAKFIVYITGNNKRKYKITAP